MCGERTIYVVDDSGTQFVIGFGCGMIVGNVVGIVGKFVTRKWNKMKAARRRAKWQAWDANHDGRDPDPYYPRGHPYYGRYYNE